MTKLELVDHTKSKRVKAYMKELAIKTGVSVEPCTMITRRLLGIMLNSTIVKCCGRSKAAPFLAARTRALLTLELNGLRVGEATGGGDMHGLLANHVSIRVLPSAAVGDPLRETCRVVIDSSKTVLGRTLVFVGETLTSRVPHARFLRELWAASGVETTLAFSHGMWVETPDYWVVRLSVVGLGDALLDRFMKEVVSASAESVRAHATASKRYAKAAAASKSKDDETRFVYVAGGRKRSAEVAEAVAWLAWLGVPEGLVSVVPGPLLRATEPGSGKVTHMPLMPKSTYGQLVRAIDAAYVVSEAMAEPDAELELEPGHTPKWGNHSIRRWSDKVACEHMEEDGVSKEVLNYFYGWCLEAMSKEMMLHYAGIDRGGQLVLAKCSMRI